MRQWKYRGENGYSGKKIRILSVYTQGVVEDIDAEVGNREI